MIQYVERETEARNLVVLEITSGIPMKLKIGKMNMPDKLSPK